MDSHEMLVDPVVTKRPTLTPKALIHQKFGTRACYRIEEVQESAENFCPGLAIRQQGRCLYKCRLDLPDLSVVSDTFSRKKDAEQFAAKMALEKLDIQPTLSDQNPEEIWTELIKRISSIFTDEFLLSSHPLIGHFREAFEREGDLYGCVPLSLVVACDLKTSNLCKSVNPKTESDMLLMIFLTMKAAKSHLTFPDGGLWMRKKIAYSQDMIQSLIDRYPRSAEPVQLETVLIPVSAEKTIGTVIIDIASGHYYLNEIASKLNVKDSSRVLISRPIGKASSEMRLYFPAPEFTFLSSDSSPEAYSDAKDVKQTINVRASYLSGQTIYGDAILAAVGYTWKSSDLFHEQVSLSTYYRLIVSKIPVGNYKLSREAIFVVDLPLIYSTRSSWKGPSPKDLLCMFCRHHRLSEPLFNVKNIHSRGRSVETSKSFKMLEQSMTREQIPCESGNVNGQPERDSDVMIHSSCDLKILSRQQDLIIQYFHGEMYRKQADAIQNAAFKVLSLLNIYFNQPDMPIDTLSSIGQSCGILVSKETFSREFGMCLSVHGTDENILNGYYSSIGSLASISKNENEINQFNIDNGDSCVCPPQGSLACISYTVTLFNKDLCLQEILESKDEFEFEIGARAVIHQLEAHVIQMSIGQTLKFISGVPSRDLILAAAGERVEHLSRLSLYDCMLEFSVTLLWVQEPLEDRIEQALFKPPLSKQRVEFAVRFINESHAKTLVDFGCGSGSLLDSLIERTTTLEKLVGVDISHKSLTRAAKTLHSKLTSVVESKKVTCIRSVVLYDGSITFFDSRLCGFDIGTCLEVIEHMKEEQATLFGEIVLSLFCPRLLIISTPNYEYNPILQKSYLSNKEENTKNSQAALCKFRNYDHKFEWTREQFQCWATRLASSHGYVVEFSGVGGSGDTEPGFASQIAVFRDGPCFTEDESGQLAELSHPYDVIWQWKNLPASDG